MNYEVIHLPKEQWKDHALSLGYTTTQYYDVEVRSHEAGFTATFRRETFETPVTHTPEEYDFPDRLYADWREHAFAWGIVSDGELKAVIETCPEEFSNRLRVTELWVSQELRRQGVGRTLMALAKEQARRERRRAVILETQSCNANAIDFYLREGFTLIGFDLCAYSNRDSERREVRIELGWFPPEKKKLKEEDILIREERPEDRVQTERMTQRAFWNKHRPGCSEHLLVRKLRTDGAYVPEISRVAVQNGQIVGCILYSRAFVRQNGEQTEVLTFGPLCVDPDFQGCNIGQMLLQQTMRLAAEAGYRGIIIYGEPDYYPKFGFKTCDNFGITTPEGKNFNAFMGIELKPGGLEGVRGAFYEAEVFHRLSAEETEEINREFPPLIKQKFPGQWE